MVSPIPIADSQQYLNKQGISESEALELGMVSLSANECSLVLGFPVRNPGIVIPYPNSEYFRVRMLGGDTKYLSRKDSGHAPLYLPKSSVVPWEDLIVSPGLPLAITEGEIKAHKSSLMGMPTIGIGGVSMQLYLFNSGIVWKKRLVYVVFDHDGKGIERGQYKPGVADALGKLCSRLSAEGALVKVVQIGMLSRLDANAKWGIDDALRAGASWEELIATAVDAPEWCEDLSQLLTKCVYVEGTNHTHIYNLENDSRKSVSDFRDAHIAKIRSSVGQNGKFKVEQLSDLWMLHPQRLTALTYDLNPKKAFGYVEEDGLINLWRGYPGLECTDVELGQTVKEGWQRYMEGLFGEEWQWVGLWTAHMLFRPWERTNQAVLVVSRVQGIGKSLYGDVVRDLVGGHGVECSASRMFNQFNSDMEAKSWVMVNELDIKFNAKEGQLNDLLAEETVKIEQKGKDVVSLPNLRRWYLTANSSSPCRLSRGQRRVLVINPPRVELDTRGEWGQWINSEVALWRKNKQCLGAIKEWFEQLWYDSGLGEGVWDSTRPVPITQAAIDAAEASMTVGQIIADHMMEFILAMDGGWCSVHPDLKKRDVKVFGELLGMVKAMGGMSSQKTVKEEGVVKTYTVYDLGGRLEKSVKPSSGNTTVIIDAEECRSRGVRFAAEFIKITDMLTK